MGVGLLVPFEPSVHRVPVQPMKSQSLGDRGVGIPPGCVLAYPIARLDHVALDVPAARAWLTVADGTSRSVRTSPTTK